MINSLIFIKNYKIGTHLKNDRNMTYYVSQYQSLGLLISTHASISLTYTYTLQAFLEEVEQWKPCIEAVNESGERLISDFSTDDTGRIRQILQRVGERWAHICERYVS